MITNTSENRLLSLDALRGLSILLMVLSGSIAFGGVLPAWMYHAQVPPPLHVFNPEIAGITWVDLVFPFFLFTMGTALPLALNSKLKQIGALLTIAQVLKRYILLIFFAIFTYYARAWVMSSSPSVTENLFSIGCFASLFLMLSKTNFERSNIAIGRQLVGFTLALAFLVFYPFNTNGFNINKSDIIIVVLANMALFGSIIWIFTKNNPWLRVIILPFVMAIFLSGKIENSWTNTLFNWSPAPWAYTFYYLKYLFIIIPGTFAGDWILEAKAKKLAVTTTRPTTILAITSLILVVSNVAFLFGRQLTTNLILSVYLSIVIVFLARKSRLAIPYQRFAQLGVCLLLLGLAFEPYEGGIKKDPSTYSYYFVCGGMALLTLFTFMLLEVSLYAKKTLAFLAKVGQNPMIAYTAGNLFLIPLFSLTGFSHTFSLLNQNPWSGFAKGVFFTILVALIAFVFSKKRIFWKT